ncbi:unnamed protein product, partial [Closterium sp. NIES-53]
MTSEDNSSPSSKHEPHARRTAQVAQHPLRSIPVHLSVSTGSHVASKISNEVIGRMSKQSEFLKKAHWWRAQATRFMLRWPSAYLCHIINRERHHVYGMHVARQVVASQMDLRTLLGESRESNKSAGELGGLKGRGGLLKEQKLLVIRMEQRSVLEETWGSSKLKGKMGGFGGSGTSSEERQLLAVRMDQRSTLEETWGSTFEEKVPLLPRKLVK